MKCICRIILKEVNVCHKYLKRPNIQDSIFEVLRTSVSLDKVDLSCAKVLRVKLTGND